MAEGGFESYGEGHEHLGYGRDLVDQLWPVQRAKRIFLSTDHLHRKFRDAMISLAADTQWVLDLMEQGEDELPDVFDEVGRFYDLDDTGIDEAIKLCASRELDEIEQGQMID